MVFLPVQFLFDHPVFHEIRDFTVIQILEKEMRISMDSDVRKPYDTGIPALP